MNYKDQVAIVVSSCDAFQDCWEPFIFSCEKYGCDCPYNIFIVSNNASISTATGNIQFLKVGADQKWASNLRIALQKISTEYIIYLQEDYFFNKMINWSEVQTHIDYCIENQIDYLRLTLPYIPGEIKDKHYTQNKLDQAYSVCLQAAIWRKSILENLCVEGWSGWDFERHVSALIREQVPDFKFLGLSRGAKGQIPYVRGTAVRKGKWTNPGWRFLRKNGFGGLLNKRAREPFYQELVDFDGWLRPVAKSIWKIINSCSSSKK